MGMRFTLKETLELLGVSTNQLITRCKVRKNTIYDMTHNKSKRIEIENLSSIVHTLNEIAKEQGIKKKFNTEDVIIWEED